MSNVNRKLTSVGQLKLKRTVFENPKIVRVYMDADTYLTLNINATYAGVTVDEHIRNLIEADLGNSKFDASKHEEA